MPVSKTGTAISEQLGLDDAWCEAQLKLAALENVSRENLRLLQLFLEEGAHIGPVAAAFLEFLDRQPETSVMLRGFDRERLTASLETHLREYTLEFGTAGFFERQVNLTLVHVRLGVSPGLYLGALGFQCSLLLERIVLGNMSKEQRQQLILLVARLTSLETLIAAEVYQRALARLDRRSHAGAAGLALAMDADAVLERDEITGVVTRRVLMDALQQNLETTRKTGQILTLMLLELDDFKNLVGEIGDSGGDQALRLVGRMIKASVREFDLIGRVGTQVFAVILDGASLHTAHQVCERIRRRVLEGGQSLQDKQVKLTVSQGLGDALRNDDQHSLFARCHRALERARSAGGNRVVEDTGLAAGR